MAQKKINKFFKKVLTKSWEAPTMGTLKQQSSNEIQNLGR
jgi:hypothetical protein